MGRNSCCVKQKLRKGLWSPEEDEKLYNYITRFGVGCWSSVPKLAGLQRCGKSCRLRWINYLRPDLKRGMFSQQEEDLIINLHEALGNRWAQIAAQLPGRTDNEIKNFWNSSLKKKLLKQGVDPNTHKPINESKDEREREEEERESLNHHHHHHHHHHQEIFLPITSNSSHQAMYNLSSSGYINGGKMAANNLSNDPLFLPELQPNVDFLSHPHHNPFNSMPNLTSFDVAETSRIEGRELSFGNSMMMMMNSSSNNGGGGGGGGFSWEEESKQTMDSVFQFQFSGIQIEEKINTNSDDFDTYNMSSVFDHHRI